MVEQEAIERSVIGKRVVAVAWVPDPLLEGAFELQSITLEGGIKLNLWVETFREIVMAEIVESNS